MFDIAFKRHGHITVATIELAQIVDAAIVTDIGDEILGHVEENKGAHLLIRFERVEFMSSSLLSELLRVNETTQRYGGSIRLCGLRPEAREVFALTKLDDLFVICDDCAECLKRFRTEVGGEPE